MNDLNQKTILLVEDELDLALMEISELENEGYNVIHATNGQNALHIVSIQKKAIDLILLDIDLGSEMDGTNVACEILKTNSIPIVFLFSHIEKEIAQKIEKISPYGYILKSKETCVFGASIKMAFKLIEAYEKKLEESEWKYSILFERSGISAALTKIPENTFVDVNNAFETLFEFTKEEVIGKTSLELGITRPEDQANILLKLQKYNNINKNEKIIFTKSGKIKTVIINISNVEMNNKKYVITTIHDITERKKAEEALKESEARMTGIVNSAKDAIISIDSQLNIVLFNGSAEKMFGINSDEMIGKPLDRLIPEKFRLSHVSHILEFSKTGISTRDMGSLGQIKGLRSSGEEFPIEASISQISFGNNQKLFTVILRDITKRKQADDKIQNLLIEKEHILKEVHHRVKNNMSIIYSMLSIKANAQTDNKMKNILMDACGMVKSMTILYDKLYRSNNEGYLSIKDFFSPLIAEIIRIFPGSESIKFETSLDDIALDQKILSPLGIIINELITNSMKYAFVDRADGLIILKVTKNGNNILLIYEDNGIGLNESISIENSPGFGLKLISLLIKQLKGSIKIEKENGTRYIISFEIR